VGGAIGLSCLVTLALRHATGQLSLHTLPAAAFTHGYVLSWRVGAALLAVGGLLVFALLEHVLATPRNPEAELVAQPLEALVVET
jgi:hypothetical protein